MTSICSEANFRFNFCVSNFSALLPSWVHFLGLTHSENSAKCLIYWFYPFLLPRILINSFLCTCIFFSVISMKFGNGGKPDSYVSPAILNVKSILLSSIFRKNCPYTYWIFFIQIFIQVCLLPQAEDLKEVIMFQYQ